MAANDKTAVGQGSGSWETPGTERPGLFWLLNRRWRFTYDPFAEHHNAKCDTYSTLDGTFHLGKQIDTLNGLQQTWAGRRVFANPPYSRGLIDRCVQKAIDEWESEDPPACCVYLVPSSPSAQWFRQLRRVADIVELPQRVAFIHPPYLCGPKCKHQLGVPLTSPPSDMVVAEFRVTEQQWLQSLARLSRVKKGEAGAAADATG